MDDAVWNKAYKQNRDPFASLEEAIPITLIGWMSCWKGSALNQANNIEITQIHPENDQNHLIRSRNRALWKGDGRRTNTN